MGDTSRSGHHFRERRRNGEVRWMMVLGATVAALASVVALLVVRSTPTVTVPAALQVGTSSGGQATPTLHPTQTPRVIVVTPDEPVSDNDDNPANSSKSGDSSTTAAGQN